MQNYYTKLGVKRDASLDEIKKAYLKQLKKYHPDIYSGDQDFAQKKTAELNEIYGVLKDKKLRQKYDYETFEKPQQEILNKDEMIDENLFSQMIIRLRKGFAANKQKAKEKKNSKANSTKTKNVKPEEKPVQPKPEKPKENLSQSADKSTVKQELVKKDDYKPNDKDELEKKRLMILIGSIVAAILLIVLIFLII